MNAMSKENDQRKKKEERKKAYKINQDFEIKSEKVRLLMEFILYY